MRSEIGLGGGKAELGHSHITASTVGRAYGGGASGRRLNSAPETFIFLVLEIYSGPALDITPCGRAGGRMEQHTVETGGWVLAGVRPGDRNNVRCKRAGGKNSVLYKRVGGCLQAGWREERCPVDTGGRVLAGGQ